MNTVYNLTTMVWSLLKQIPLQECLTCTMCHLKEHFARLVNIDFNYHKCCNVIKITHSSIKTAQSGKNNACVRPAPCIPINMSELCVIWCKKIITIIYFLSCKDLIETACSWTLVKVVFESWLLSLCHCVVFLGKKQCC